MAKRRANQNTNNTNNNNNCKLTIVYALMAFAYLCNHVCLAYKGIIPPNEEHPGTCLYRDEKLQLGVNYRNAPCQKLTCQQDGSIEVEGCGKVRIEDCNRGERMNLNQSFPECCWFKYKCKNEDGSSFYIDRNMAENAA